MREINLTEGNDAKLNALMKRRGELFPVELSEEVKAEVVSRIGTRTACSCVVTDKGRVLVDISGELPSGGYILAVYGVLDGHKWRSACRGLHITKVTMPGIGNGMIAEGDPYDIEMEVEMYIQPSSNEAIRIHNEDGEAHADIRRMIPKIPANIVTDENYHHTDENYTSVEKEKLAHLENYDDTQIRQMIAATSGNFVNYYQKKDIYSKLQMDNMLQAIKNGMFVTYEGEELPEPTEDWIGKILLFRNEVPLEELPEEEEPIVDPDQPIHEPEEVIEEEEIVDGNRGLRNTRTAPVSTNYYEEYIVIADEQHPVEKLAGINEETGEEEFELIYPLKWECIGSVKIDLSGYTTTKEMTAAIREAAEGKVDKIPGKGLSTNDFTNKDKQKLDELTPTEEQVDELLKAVATGSFVATDSLPKPSEECLGKIYLIPHPDPETENIRDEYICILNPDYVEGESEAEDKYIWENIGSTKIDLSDYYTKSDVDSILKASQADWDVSNADSLAHIKNRTHYEEKNAVIQSFVDEEVSATLLERQFEQGGSQTWKVLLNIGNYSKDYTLKIPHDDYDADTSRPPIKTDLKYNDDFIYIGGYIYDNNVDSQLGLILLNEGRLKEVLTAVQLDPNDSAGASYSLGTLSADRIGDIVKKLDPKFLPDGTKIPDGGTAGQILSKKTDADQDVEWTTLQQEFLLLDFTQSVNVNAPAIASGSNPVNIDVYVPTSYQEKWKISSLPKFECKNGTTRVDVVFGSAFSMDGQKVLRLRTFVCGTESKQITSIGGAMLLMKR